MRFDALQLITAVLIERTAITIEFSIIVAHDLKRGIGKDNKLPWRLADDLRQFKKLTIGENPITQNVVLMGRKTWQSLPPNSRPLPGRRNIVLTRQADFRVPEGVLKFLSLEDAVGSIKDDTQCFVIGGGEIYTQAIANPVCKLLYVTEVYGDFDCDVFFPPYQDLFMETQRSDDIREGTVDYCYKLLKRRQSGV